MTIYILVKQDFRHKDNIAVFDTQEKAKIYQSSLENELFENSNLCGVSFYIEEFSVV